MARTDWLPAGLTDRTGVFNNIDAKIDAYAARLGLTAGQLADIHRLCGQFKAARTYIQACRSTMQSAYSWQKHILKGDPQGSAAPVPARFPVYVPGPDDKIGIIEEMRSLREIIVAAPGYTDAIGEDLMILAGSRARIELRDRTPELKLGTGPDYRVSLSGRMHRIDALRVEYQANGGSEWVLAAFLTALPATFRITPATPGVPEAGRIRSRYIHKNEPVGNYSSEHAVTISA